MKTRLLLVLFTIIAAVIRAVYLSQPMRYDEAATFILFVRHPLDIGLSYYPVPNNHLFHTLLAHWSVGLLGSAEWAIRLPAFIAGVLMVPVGYLCFRRLYDKPTGLLAAALIASSSVLIEYSTNARGYTLLALLFLVLLTMATQLRSYRPTWIVFSIVAALAFWTIPVMLYGYAVLIVWLLATTRYYRSIALSVALTLFLTLILYSPVIVGNGIGALVSNPFVTPLSWSAFFATLPASLLETISQWHRDIPVPLVLVLLTGFGVSLWTKPQSRRLGMIVVVVISGLLVVQHVVPFTRTWLFLLPVYLGVCAAGITHLVKTPILAPTTAIIMSLLVLASGSVLQSTDTGVLPDAQAITTDLMPLADDTGVLAVVPSDRPLQYYFYRHGIDPYRVYDDLRSKRRIYVVVNGNNTLQSVMMRYEGLSLDHFQQELLATYPQAQVYLLTLADVDPLVSN